MPPCLPLAQSDREAALVREQHLQAMVKDMHETLLRRAAETTEAVASERADRRDEVEALADRTKRQISQLVDKVRVSPVLSSWADVPRK